VEHANNKKLLIIAGVLLVLVGGFSFAYFMVNNMIGGPGASVTMTTANISGTSLTVEGTLSFNDLDILPGHKTVSSLKLTATGPNELIPYNLVWTGTNSLNTTLNFTVYKSKTNVNVSATCNKVTKIVNGDQHLNEDCTISGIASLEQVSTGIITKTTGENKVILSNQETIISSEDGEIAYYYVVLEYPNLEENQNIDIGGSFSGLVTVEKNEETADLIVDALYLKQSDGTYKLTDTGIPEGYTFNTDKSNCTKGATPTWSNGSLNVNNFTTSGTVCTLYFDN